MEGFIETADIQKYLDEKKYDELCDVVIDKTLNLVKKIAKKKNIYLNPEMDENSISIFYSIQLSFERESVSFSVIPSIMRQFERWKTQDEEDDNENQILMIVNMYNRIIMELEDYEKIEKEIRKKGYKQLEKEKIDKLISLFKEMLEYKNKEYKEEWRFNEWINNIDTQYHFFHDSLSQTLEKIRSGIVSVDEERYGFDSVEVNQVEKIMRLNDLYYELSDEEEGYKQYANYYKEIELENGQTYKDIYDLEKENFVKLFKEMLDFANIKYDTDDFYKLSVIVKKYYPQYEDTLTNLSVIMWDSNETYIELLSSMRNIYEKLSKNYKNKATN